MLLKTLTLAAGAAAFLLVPEVAKVDEDLVHALPFDPESFQMLPSALEQSLIIPCEQCKGRDSYLHLDFEVVDMSRLMLNGFELYPNTDPWNGDLVATLTSENRRAKHRTLGYSLAVSPDGHFENEQIDLIGVELRVIEVGSRFVEGVPAIKVSLIKTAATNEILISGIEIKAAVEVECDTTWCRAKELFSGLFRGVGGCGRNRHGHQAAESHTMQPQTGVDGHDQVSNTYDHREHGHRRPHWGRLWKNVAAYIFLPVLMGITAGVSVALYVCLAVFKPYLCANLIAALPCSYAALLSASPLFSGPRAGRGRGSQAGHHTVPKMSQTPRRLP